MRITGCKIHPKGCISNPPKGALRTPKKARISAQNLWLPGCQLHHFPRCKGRTLTILQRAGNQHSPFARTHHPSPTEGGWFGISSSFRSAFTGALVVSDED